ncbi:MAG: metallophosphoesterase [Mucilaginibacter sp.]|uniref:metallophosphoesterase n=1 Tax=Mucilaginibacter sp. TaxID=1882438 RepID=UPI003262E0C0
MDSQLIVMLALSVGLILADMYIISGIRGISKKWKITRSASFTVAYWIFSFFLLTGLYCAIFFKLTIGVKGAILMIFFIVWIAKVLFLPFIVVDDVRRYFLYRARKNNKPEPEFPASQPAPDAIPRSAFLMKAGLVAGALPLASLTFGIISGAYDYQIQRRTLYLPNLPKKFDGIKLGQLSDIHSGSFYNKKAVLGGVEMLMREKADFIFFTGDLVNNKSDEMREYQDIFSKVKAPLGVYSSLGNHDYGDYHIWPSPEAKKKNLDDLKATHKNMGWDLILNSNRRLKVDGEEIGILGVENWGSMSRFPKYGRVDLALENTDDLPVKLLLSHDPSHWRAQVLNYKQVDMMFSGHTHGMQFGVKTANFQWSPIQYVYKEWSGFYREGNQQLYVNTGYGFLGYPGRVGILPEITIFTLKASADPALKSKLS